MFHTPMFQKKSEEVFNIRDPWGTFLSLQLCGFININLKSANHAT
jgi:hypothetical protein